MSTSEKRGPEVFSSPKARRPGSIWLQSRLCACAPMRTGDAGRARALVHSNQFAVARYSPSDSIDADVGVHVIQLGPEDRRCGSSGG